MAQKAVKLQTHDAASDPRTGTENPMVALLNFARLMAPRSAIHMVTIRHHVDPAKKTQWVVCPGTFHVWRGDQVYWSAAGSAARIEFDDQDLIGVDSLEVPCDGTRMGVIQADAPNDPQHYRVLVGNTPAQGDDGSDPTIIVDD